MRIVHIVKNVIVTVGDIKKYIFNFNAARRNSLTKQRRR